MAKVKRAGARKATPKAPAVPAWRIVGRKQLALILGVHVDTVSEWGREGMPVIQLGRFGRESRYDSAACLQWWRSHRCVKPIEVALTNVLNGRAGLSEHKLRIVRAGLVAADDVQAAGRAYMAGWVAVVRSIARCARSAGIVTTDDAEAGLDELCRQILRDIRSWKTRADQSRGKE